MSNRGRKKRKTITKNSLLKEFNAQNPKRFEKLTISELEKILEEQIKQGNRPDFHPFEIDKYASKWRGGVDWTPYNNLKEICLKIIDYNSKPW